MSAAEFLRVSRLRALFGLTFQQASTLARLAYGEVAE